MATDSTHSENQDSYQGATLAEELWAKKGGCLKWFLVFVGVCSLLLLIMTGPFFLQQGRASEKSRRINCASNLKQIGLALKMYSLDYDDHFPPFDGAKGLNLLVKHEYLTDRKIYLCPSTSTNIPTFPLTDSQIDYVYIGGLTENDNPDSPICWDKPTNHKKYGNILFLDGHVKGYAGTQWLKNHYKK